MKMNEVQLIQFAEELEAQARGIRQTVALWNAKIAPSQMNSFSTALSGAMKLRGKRGSYSESGEPADENGNGNYQRGSGKTGKTRRSTEELIADTKAALADGPLTAVAFANKMGYNSSGSVYAMLNKLKKTKLIADGAMTAEGQTYVLAEPKRRDHHGKAEKNRQSKEGSRQRTANLLAAMSTTDPGPAPGMGTSMYLRKGYIKKKGDGYVRTDKEFQL